MMSLLFLLSFAFAEEPVEPAVDAEGSVEAPVGPDRSGPPAVRNPVPLPLDDLEKHVLSNGLEVYHVRIPRLRDVSVELNWWQGRLDLEGRNDEAVDMMSQLWGVSSEKYDPAALSELEDLNDMMVFGAVGSDNAYVLMNAPLDKLDEGLDLMADVALHPTFPKREVRIRQEEAERWYGSEGPKSISAVAQSALGYSWFAADHPYGRRPDVERYLSVKAKDLPGIHEQILHGKPMSLLVIGDLDYADIQPKLEAHFKEIEVGEGERAKPVEVDAPVNTRILAIDMPESEQAVIRMRMEAPARSHEDRTALGANSWALGGHFLSRFNKNLREDKGWTYGVRARYSASPTYGTFGVSVDVPVDKFAVAVGELNKELSEVVVEGLTEDELEARWRGAVKSFNDTRGTIDSAEAFYGSLHTYQETVQDRIDRLEAIHQVALGAAQATAVRWMGPDATRIWVVAGPKEQLMEGFEALGWEPEWIDADDALLGRF